MRKYLIIEDDEVFIFLHEHVMRNADPDGEIISMKSSLHAVDYINDLISKGEKAPDCILLDLNMPEMNGFEFWNIASRCSVIFSEILIFI